MESAPAASLIVVDPSGHRQRIPLEPLPFRIGRHADNHFVVRDNRASRNHAEIDLVDGAYVVRDAQSRHGVFVNGARVKDRILHNSDKIEFGFPDSYHFVFAEEGAELQRLMEQFPDAATVQRPHNHLGKLRAILEVARALQTSFSLEEVLGSVVDAALAVTGAERGFLLLKDGHGEELETRIARDNHGHDLAATDLRVPRRVLHRALQHRRDLLSMNFDPASAGENPAERSIADLELRSVVCVPLVRIQRASGDATNVITAGAETVGLLYMDSRHITADLGGGNRELLQTLAIEASTILENARLLEQERAKQKIDEELALARTIQQNLLPQSFPQNGWLVAAGSSTACYQVGGDYFDLIPFSDDAYALAIADVSGKGVGAALLAGLLQGAFVTGGKMLEQRIGRLNRFLLERTCGERYATLFYALLDSSGQMRYVNAGHCAPLILEPDGSHTSLEATAMPVGLVEGAEFLAGECRLRPGDRVVIYSDGVTEAQNAAGEFFGKRRLREALLAAASCDAASLHEAVQKAVTAFTEGADQSDDMTLLVIEFRGPQA